MIVRDFRFTLNQSVIYVSVNVDHWSILQMLRKDKGEGESKFLSLWGLFTDHHGKDHVELIINGY